MPSERPVKLWGIKKLRVVAGQDIVCEKANGLDVAPGSKILEGSYPDVAGGDPRQHGSRKLRLAENGLAGRTAASARVVGIPSAAIASLTIYSRRTGPRAARPSPRARTAWAQSPSAGCRVARRRGRRPPREERSPVAELRHEMPELVPGISHGNWFGAFGNTVAG